MNIDYSAYEGFKVKGYTETVISRGKVVIEKGNYVGRAGDGAFVKRRAYGGQYANTHANMARDVLTPRAALGSPASPSGNLLANLQSLSFTALWDRSLSST